MESDDESDKLPEPKRGKLEADSSKTESNVTNDNAPVVTPINDDVQVVENDSVDLETDLNNKVTRVLTNRTFQSNLYGVMVLYF